MDGSVGAGPAARSLYEADEHAWMLAQLRLIEEGRLGELDAKHLAEYLRDVTIGDRRRLQSRLSRLYQHILKFQHQRSRATRSWVLTIVEQQARVRRLLRGTPSLRQYLPDVLSEAYEDARRLAAAETGLPIARFPEEPPMDVDAALAWEPPDPSDRPARKKKKTR